VWIAVGAAQADASTQEVCCRCPRSVLSRADTGNAQRLHDIAPENLVEMRCLGGHTVLSLKLEKEANLKCGMYDLRQSRAEYDRTCNSSCTHNFAKESSSEACFALFFTTQSASQNLRDAA
jgi:hypothetical protein